MRTSYWIGNLTDLSEKICENVTKPVESLVVTQLKTKVLGK